MKKCGMVTLVLMLFIISFTETSEAKLLIISPQTMVEQSTLIVIGTVTKKEYTEQQRQISFSVESVIKGKTKQKEIDLKRNKPPMYGWLGFDFPETGTRIMVLLQQADQLTLTGDVNAVAVLDGNNVRLYKGSTMGKWTPKKYEETYQAFLDKNIESSTSPVNKSNVKGETTTDTAKQQTIKSGVLINTLILIILGVATIFIVYRILKRKRFS
jgi:hypothetical protein